MSLCRHGDDPDVCISCAMLASRPSKREPTREQPAQGEPPEAWIREKAAQEDGADVRAGAVEGTSAEQFFKKAYELEHMLRNDAEREVRELREERDALKWENDKLRGEVVLYRGGKLLERAERAESALASARQRFDAAMDYAGSRWEEWGERAMAVKDLMNHLELALKSKPAGDEQAEHRKERG